MPPWWVRLVALILASMAVVAAMFAGIGWPVQMGGHHVYGSVVGHSMDPTLHDGDLTVTDAARAVHVGDVVVYTAPVEAGSDAGIGVIHRVVGGDAVSGWVLRGDNNTYDDPWVVSTSAVEGVLVHRFAGVSRVLTPFQNPLSFVMVAAGALAWVTMPFARRR